MRLSTAKEVNSGERMNTKMKPDISERLDSSVMFSRKALDNDSVLLLRVDMTPVHNENRCGYTFITQLIGNENDYAEVDDVTSDIHTAESLFDLLSAGSVFPCQLRDVIEDCLSSGQPDILSEIFCRTNE